MNPINRVLRLRRTKWLLLSLIVGCLSFSFSINLSEWADSQSSFYNQALAAYKAGKPEQAAALFVKSQSAYQVNVYRQSDQSLVGVLSKLVFPAPDRGLAARASFHLAKIYIYGKQLPKAVQAFNQSLALNPGNGYLQLDLTQLENWRQAAMIVKYDLELLYEQNPSQMQAQAQGQQGSGGSPETGDPQSSNRSDGNNPSPGAAGQGGSGQNSGTDM